MYSSDTQFLTRRGWRTVKDLDENDEICNVDGDNLTDWTLAKDADLRLSSDEISLFGCQLVKLGKFCVDAEHRIRLHSANGSGGILGSFKIRSIMDKLEQSEVVMGTIPTSFVQPFESPDPALKKDAEVFAELYPHITKITNEGALVFLVKNNRPKKVILNFLERANVPLKRIEKYTGYKAGGIMVTGNTLEDWYRAVIECPQPLANEVDYSGDTFDGRSKAIKRTTFYCPHLAKFAQLSSVLCNVSATTYIRNSNNPKRYAVTIDPSRTSVNFRHRLIIVPKSRAVVATSIEHPITRWKGSVVAL